MATSGAAILQARRQPTLGLFRLRRAVKSVVDLFVRFWDQTPTLDVGCGKELAF